MGSSVTNPIKKVARTWTEFTTLGLSDLSKNNRGEIAKRLNPDIPTPDVPGAPPPPVMPVPGQDDLSNIRARRQSIQAQLARRGRLSTILSQMNVEPLGGPS